MLNVLTAGLPLTAKEYLVEAMNLAFGEGVYEITELSKSNIRQRVRLSSKNVSFVLVVLDGVSTDLCKDIEDGLYDSDKFHMYENDANFVRFLNTKYNIDLKVPEEEGSLIAEQLRQDIAYNNEELIEKLNAQLLDKDSLIKNLYSRIKELSDLANLYGISSKDTSKNDLEIESLRKEVISLRNQLLDQGSKSNKSDEQLVDLRNQLEELHKNYEILEKREKSLLAEYESIVGELTEYKVSYSKQSGLLRSKDAEIEKLKELTTATTDLQSKLKIVDAEKASLEVRVAELSEELSGISIDLSSKDAEIARLQSELKAKGEKSDLLEGLKEELELITSERDSILKELSIKDSTIAALQQNLGELDSSIFDYKNTIGSLELKVSEDDETISTLNKDKLELQAKVRVLEKSSDRNTDLENVLSDLTDLRKKYDSLAGGVFGRISSLSLPKGSTPVKLVHGTQQLKNVRFAFAGSTESRKGAYKCLLDEFRNASDGERILIVDVVSETSIDYVFEIQKVVNGIEWFRRGGGVQPYLSSTCLKNVQVLSAGIGYVNDSYFLTVDWSSRLTELENSGYRVVFFCGDLSNIVGRVFHESFADYGTSIVYVHGNAIGSRTIVSNLRGLTNCSKSIIAYFEFNTKIKKFYELVEKSNECRVLSIING